MAFSKTIKDHSARDRQVAWLAILMFLFMLALAVVPGARAVDGLSWGASVDFHRDQAFVQALMDGHYGQDPVYLGGALWYNPLTTWIEAAAVMLTGLPIPEVLVHMGAWANLLAPISFFIMAWYFFGPERAVACTAVFLFFTIGQEPGWAVPTYSPRMIPVSFCQWFLYVELILIDRAFRSKGMLPWIVAGAGAGVAFLAHAAPAIIAVLLIALFTMRKIQGALKSSDWSAAWRALRPAVVAAVVFCIASLPLTWYIVGHYGLHVVNRSGFLYTYYALTLHGKDLFLYHNLSVVNLFALAGLWMLAANAGRLGVAKRTRWIFITWFWICVVLLAYGYTMSTLNTHTGIHLPGILPSFHFYFYAKGALTVFAGLAAWELLSRAASLVARGTRPGSAAPGSRTVFASFRVIALACMLIQPSYATRRDLFAVRNRNLAFMEDRNGIAAAEHIHDLLAWNDVVLCEVELGIWPMLPTARHVVATASTMGNPYMDQSRRQADNALLMRGMRSARSDTEDLLDAYGVTHLLVRAVDLPGLPLAGQWFPKVAYRNSEFVLMAR